MMNNLILTSAFGQVARELYEKEYLPHKPLRVAFIPTAGAFYESKPWMEADRKALINLGYSVFDVELRGQTVDELKKELEPADIIFVAGGNTTYLTERAHASGFDSIIRELIETRIYIGSSAGSLLAGPSVEPFIEEDRVELPKDFKLENPKAFGLVDYIVLPHWPNAEDEAVLKKFSNQFTFVKMTNEEYQVESV